MIEILITSIQAASPGVAEAPSIDLFESSDIMVFFRNGIVANLIVDDCVFIDVDAENLPQERCPE